jgi:hypothetical protein
MSTKPYVVHLLEDEEIERTTIIDIAGKLLIQKHIENKVNFIERTGMEEDDFVDECVNAKTDEIFLLDIQIRDRNKLDEKRGFEIAKRLQQEGVDSQRIILMSKVAGGNAEMMTRMFVEKTHPLKPGIISGLDLTDSAARYKIKSLLRQDRPQQIYANWYETAVMEAVRCCDDKRLIDDLCNYRKTKFDVLKEKVETEGYAGNTVSIINRNSFVDSMKYSSVFTRINELCDDIRDADSYKKTQAEQDIQYLVPQLLTNLRIGCFNTYEKV